MSEHKPGSAVQNFFTTHTEEEIVEYIRNIKNAYEEGLEKLYSQAHRQRVKASYIIDCIEKIKK